MSDDPHTDPAAGGVHHAHARQMDELLEELDATPHGLLRDEAAARLARFGRNALPRAVPPGLAAVFFSQFLNPLIYILLLAGGVSLALREFSDAIFIFAVLTLNALIGTIQEFNAQRSAMALQRMVTTRARVVREGDAYEIDAEELVCGDVVLLESGSKVPADLRLLAAHDLEIDESLLTGESLPVIKNADLVLPTDTSIGDCLNVAYAGSLVSRGRGRGVVVATATATQLGQLASAIQRPSPKSPLLLRMERFTVRIGIFVGGAAALMGLISFLQGTPLREIFFLAVALAVSAIPEGLPVALTVALAIGMNRMARRNVIVRRLVAVEALGSCTFIASDKTGTLTVNQLTVRRVLLPGQPAWEVTGEGTVPEGAILAAPTADGTPPQALLQRLCLAAVLDNEGFLGHRDGSWTHHGDAVDVALLVLAHKAGVFQSEALAAWPQVDGIPFESERGYAASFHLNGEAVHAFVKGAAERVLPMCERMVGVGGDGPLDAERLGAEARALAQAGYRVLALATAAIPAGTEPGPECLHGLTLLGLVGMIDPLRSEAKAAVAACRSAGMQVCMVTGDHPLTALAIARDLELAESEGQVVTGPQLREAEKSGLTAIDTLTAQAQVFARVEPRQKLDIVESLGRNGHFVAVTGDGANDAPALRAAHVGVAMGKSGTDVARETADIIVTDDNFASIVAGVEEGRIAYANVRKVIFLLISTGAAELVLFAIALATGLPLPLLAVQLLWLNLVTNGIQDVALAFEPGEGDELAQPPRPPKEPIFNRLMIERVVLSALVIGMVAYLAFAWLLAMGVGVDAARNATLLLMVLFENVQVFNSRSETRSAFRHNPLANPLLLFGTLAAQLVHIGAMYTPGISSVLGLQPVSLELWVELLGLALSVLVVMEVHKAVKRLIG